MALFCFFFRPQSNFYVMMCDVVWEHALIICSEVNFGRYRPARIRLTRFTSGRNDFAEYLMAIGCHGDMALLLVC